MTIVNNTLYISNHSLSIKYNSIWEFARKKKSLNCWDQEKLCFFFWPTIQLNSDWEFFFPYNVASQLKTDNIINNKSNNLSNQSYVKAALTSLILLIGNVGVWKDFLKTGIIFYWKLNRPNILSSMMIFNLKAFWMQILWIS